MGNMHTSPPSSVTDPDDEQFPFSTAADFQDPGEATQAKQVIRQVDIRDDDPQYYDSGDGYDPEELGDTESYLASPNEDLAT